MQTLSFTGAGFPYKQLIIHYTKTGGKMHVWTIYEWTNCTPTLTSPTNTQHLDPFHNLLCLSPGSLTGSSASRTELTFREIVYQLHSMDGLFPNPGTTSHLPWTVTVQECTVWSPFSEDRVTDRWWDLTKITQSVSTGSRREPMCWFQSPCSS